MGNFWLKMKIWTKTTVAAVLGVYALLFIYKNSGQPLTFWYWFDRKYESTMLTLVGIAFLAGVVGTILVRTTLKTVRQIQDLRSKGRLEKLEREHAEMKAKAAMLQTKTTISQSTTGATTVANPPEE